MRYLILTAALALGCSSHAYSTGFEGEDAVVQDSSGDSPDAACDPQTEVRRCGECQPGFYLSRLYDDMASCPYLRRDCSVPCGTFLWCEWYSSTPCPAGWVSAGRLSTPECGEGSDPIDGANTTVCEPLP